MKEIWSKGYTDGPNECGIWTASIDLLDEYGVLWGGIIEVHGDTEAEVHIRRDLILLAATKLNSVEVRL